MVIRQIVWDSKAKADFRKQIIHIKENSPSAADQVLTGILDIIDSLAKHPERYSLDRFKEENDGSYRAFEYKSIRVSYRHTETQIRILLIRHVRMKPKYH